MILIVFAALIIVVTTVAFAYALRAKKVSRRPFTSGEIQAFGKMVKGFEDSWHIAKNLR